jgi:hypothetical protein
MGDYIYDGYRDKWPTVLNWDTSGSRMRATTETESHPLWITTTSADDWPFEWTTTVLDELKITTNGWPNTSDLIAALMDKLNVEWKSDEDELEPELTFDELMGFEKSEEDK